MNLVPSISRLLFLKGVILVTLFFTSALASTAALLTRDRVTGSEQVPTIETTHYPFANSAGLTFVPVISQSPGGVTPEPVVVQPNFEINGQGENVDSIAFWEAPEAAETLMFVTAKDNQLVEVWQYPFVDYELPPLQDPAFGSNAQVNGLAVDQKGNRLYVSVSAPKSTVGVFSLPDLTFIETFLNGAVNLQSEPNVTLLEHAGGQSWLYVSSETSVYIHNALTGVAIGQFEPSKGLETMAADNFYQAIYVPDENDRTGIYAYQPDGTPYEHNGTNNFGGNAFDDDAEGIILYTCPADGSRDDGRGFIVIAEQRNDLTDFEFFDRQTWVHLATLNIAGVSNTDGIASTQRSLPGYPLGIFAAINDDTSVAGVGWDVVLNALDLSCSTSAAAATLNVAHSCPVSSKDSR
ncbi:MAG TPA: phytase [Anaerolineae bacterium]